MDQVVGGIANFLWQLNLDLQVRWLGLEGASFKQVDEVDNRVLDGVFIEEEALEALTGEIKILMPMGFWKH